MRFRRNIGKGAALTAGIRAAQDDLIFMMDADLQDDPAEIPQFVQKLDEGVVAVSTLEPIGDRPLLLYSVAMTLLGAQAMLLGLIAELIVHYTSRDSDTYSVAEEAGRVSS